MSEPIGPRSKCKARKRNGQPCGKWPRHGQQVCESHGGNSPRALAAAERRLQDEAAEQAVQTYGLPVDVSPTEALLDEVKWTAGHVAWLRQQVQAIERDALVWGKTEEVDKGAGEFVGVDVTHAAAPNVWLDLYYKERRHLLDVCKAAIQAGVEERRVRLAEQQGQLLASVIRAILDDLGLSAEQQAKVATVVPRHLRAVAA